MKRKGTFTAILTAALLAAGMMAAAGASGEKENSGSGGGKPAETAAVGLGALEAEKDSRNPSETDPGAEKESQAASKAEKESEAAPKSEKEGEAASGSEAEADGPLVVIDAGHQGPGQDMSGTEPIGPGSDVMKAKIVTGTEGRTTGLAEYELNLEIALLLQEELEARGYRVLMTRTTNDINISNIERAEVANEAGADIMVRIHANGVDETSVAGALTMIPSPGNPYVGDMYTECFALANCILNAYCAETGLENDGIMETDDMTGINWCEMPVTILEMGFMTNPGDDTYMADESNHPAMAAGIANGIDDYFADTAPDAGEM